MNERGDATVNSVLQSKGRIVQIDYLKSVLIVLMVVFHLVYIGDKYPYAKQVVYTFHMSAFLIISGYLANSRKRLLPFLRSMLWFFIPYALMELGYVAMSAILPVREHIEELSLIVLMEKLFISPMGPYWYLHTLLICYITYYAVDRLFGRFNTISSLVVLGLALWGLSEYLHLLSMANAIYFMLGVLAFKSKRPFLSLFQPSFWAIIPLILLCLHPDHLNRFSLAGVVITILSICFSLSLYRFIPTSFLKVSHYIGRNTLAILLFSPIFTILSKAMVPFFQFDPTGLCFTSVALPFVIIGSLVIAWAMDKMNLSRWFCGKPELLTHSQ